MQEGYPEDSPLASEVGTGVLLNGDIQALEVPDP
jgi:hypothetical protein